MFEDGSQSASNDGEVQDEWRDERGCGGYEKKNSNDFGEFLHGQPNT